MDGAAETGSDAAASDGSLSQILLRLAAARDEPALLQVCADEVGRLLDAQAVVLGRIGLSGGVTDKILASPLEDPRAAEKAAGRASALCERLCAVEAARSLDRAMDEHGIVDGAGSGLSAAQAGGAWLMCGVEVDGGVAARILVLREPSATFDAADRSALVHVAAGLRTRWQDVRQAVWRQRRLRALEATSSIAQVLAPPTRLDEGLAHVAQTAARVVRASAVAVLEEADSDASRPDILAVAGPEARAIPDVLFDIDPQVLAAAPETEVVLIPARRGRLVVLVPLNAHLSFSGVLLCLLEPGVGLGYDEAETLGTFADQTGLALDRAQAVSDRQELLLISDRDRIARDLHDVVIQRLFATGLRLQGLRRHLDDEASRQRFDEAVGDLDVTISDIRGTIFDLQQAPSNQARDTVRRIVREYIPLLGFTPVVRTSGPVDTVVADDLLDQVAAVLRECLSNMMRHAEASSAVVELETDDRQVVLRVADDGVGMPAEPGRRSGLENMRARAAAHGGGSRAYAGGDGGTVVEWWVPRRSRESSAP